MNKFYYYEGEVYNNKSQLDSVSKNYINKKYIVIETNKSFDKFFNDFHNIKDNSSDDDLTAIEVAKFEY